MTQAGESDSVVHQDRFDRPDLSGRITQPVSGEHGHEPFVTETLEVRFAVPKEGLCASRRPSVLLCGCRLSSQPAPAVTGRMEALCSSCEGSGLTVPRRRVPDTGAERWTSTEGRWAVKEIAVARLAVSRAP